MTRTAAQWAEILIACQVKPHTAAIWSEILAAGIDDSTFSAGDAELGSFLGQMLVESALLEHLEENLNYSAERLTQVWPSRFPTVDDAQPYAHNPQALANKVYAGRNGNTDANDGWRYRGRGMGVTFKNNYAELERATGIGFVATPELMAEPAYALRAFIAWWEGHVPDAVMGNITKVTRIVNGGTIGLAQRQIETDLASKAIA